MITFLPLIIIIEYMLFSYTQKDRFLSLSVFLLLAMVKYEHLLINAEVSYESICQ